MSSRGVIRKKKEPKKKEGRSDFTQGSKVYQGEIKRLSNGHPKWSIKQGDRPSFSSQTPMTLEQLHEKYPGSVIKPMKA